MSERPVGRFAPTPSGLLHAGSLVAALASWLDARAQGGRWLVRIEDLDTARNVEGASEAIVDQLGRCGLVADGPVVRQSDRTRVYGEALASLVGRGLAYPCGCSRRDIEAAAEPDGAPRPRHGERVYPGTCRDGLRGKPARAWRLHLDRLPGGAVVEWHDRRLGAQQQDVAREVGDFVLQRADGVFAYQLAVVVDDAGFGVTDVVRGEDLADNTARQILLQRALASRRPTDRRRAAPLPSSRAGMIEGSLRLRPSGTPRRTASSPCRSATTSRTRPSTATASR